MIQLALLTALACLTFGAPAFAEAGQAAAAGSAGLSADEAFKMLSQGKRLSPERVYEAPDKPTVYLTFDDGPSKLTGRVLDILAKEQIKATFFALGESAEAHPDLIKRIVQEGHTLGNHSYDHVYTELYASFPSFWEQIAKTEQILNTVAGVRPELVRAPGGTFSNFDAYYYYLMEQAGYTMIDWTADSGDSRRAGVPVEEILRNVKASKLTHEINILFHDGTGHDATVEALPEVIRYYKEQGYVFAPLSAAVKPSQFSLGKPKWKRSMSEPEFTYLLGEVQAHAALRQQEQAVLQTPEQAAMHDDTDEETAAAEALSAEQTRRQAETAAAESQAAMPQSALPPLLLIQAGGGGFLSPQTAYSLNGERIEVPLRLLVERLGGQVDWEEASKTARVRCGITEIAYSLSEQAIRVYTLGQLTNMYHLPDMRLADDSLQVSLTGALALLDGRVTGAGMDDGRRVVAVTRPAALFWKSSKEMLNNSLYAYGS